MKLKDDNCRKIWRNYESLSFFFFKDFIQHHMEGLPQLYNLNGFIGNETDIYQPTIIVRAEEALIVVLVFVLWIAAIILFFNRWGKIRMLEPYQPKFNQQHRSSCPLMDTNIAQFQHHSFSKFNLAGDVFLSHPKLHRPRQNSVFVGSSVTTFPKKAPRKVKSAFDLQNLIFSDSSIGKSTLKINFNSDQCDNVQVVEERKMSIRDLDIGKCHSFLNKELNDNEIFNRCKKNIETKHRPNISNSNSTTESRHNSVTNQDLKTSPLHSTKLDNTERKSSLFLGPTEFLPSSQAVDLKDSMVDMKNCRDKYRRNSMLLINSIGFERSSLSPRESIKSGVIDFRRNSMLIINNLTEDLGCSTLGKDFSLGGSHLVLGSDLFKPDRRNSFIQPGSYEGKAGKERMIQCQPIVKSKNVSGAKYNFFHSPETKYISSQKASKSLDCTESGKVVGARNKKEISQPMSNSEIMQQLSVPSELCSFEGSSASLRVECNDPKTEPLKEIHSSYNLDRISKIKETKYIKKCKIPYLPPRKLSAEAYISWTLQPAEESTSENQILSDIKKIELKSPVSISTSLTNLNSISVTPLKVLSSKKSFDKKMYCI